MVDSWYCLDWVVPERMSQVWRRSEVGKHKHRSLNTWHLLALHKQRSLNTWLSSGTSTNTSCRSQNAPGRMIQSDLFWYGNNLKMKPTYREKNLRDYLFGGFRSTFDSGGWYFCQIIDDSHWESIECSRYFIKTPRDHQCQTLAFRWNLMIVQHVGYLKSSTTFQWGCCCSFQIPNIFQTRTSGPR